MTIQVASRDAAARQTTVAEANKGYMSGFGNGFETEALAGALPVGRNSPQKCPYGLYAEQLSGSPFTAPRTTNERSWLYRIRPTVMHWGEFEKADIGLWRTAPCSEIDVPIAPMRWDPIDIPDEKLSFIEGVRTMTTAGDAGSQAGMGAHLYLITRSMQDEYFYNADAEMMFVPQQGELRLWTEFGIIDIEPGEIAVIPRGVKIRVELTNGCARGYLCENYGGALTLPERGPIGANCLANQRDFLTPVAAYEEKDVPGKLFVKWGGNLVGSSARTFPARRDRLAWKLCAVQIRSAQVLAGWPDLVRSCRSVDLHGTHRSFGDARYRQYRFCDLSGPMARRGKHLPPALVSHECHERVHGPDLWPVRRQAARLRARRNLAPQHHAAAWSGR